MPLYWGTVDDLQPYTNQRLSVLMPMCCKEDLCSVQCRACINADLGGTGGKGDRGGGGEACLPGQQHMFHTQGEEWQGACARLTQHDLL